MGRDPKGEDDVERGGEGGEGRETLIRKRNLKRLFKYLYTFTHYR
jgi:hypothetical protein